MHTHASSAFDNSVTKTFELRANAGPVTAIHTVHLPSLELIAQTFFLLERGHKNIHTYTVTDATNHHSTHP